MAWMMDTYSMNIGATASGVVTGKPVQLGGSLGRARATGRGVFITGADAARRIGLEVRGARVAVQGFGNVGAAAADLFHAAGARIVALQDATGTAIDPKGLDIPALLARPRGAKLGAGVPDEAFWDADCEILVPAAIEGQVTAERAQRIKAKLVLEGANGPCVPQADAILAERGVLVVPDVICNAGGVTVSYFEWVQDFSSYFWTEAEINERLERILLDAFAHIWSMAEKHRVPLRTAAFALACERVLSAHRQRGLYP
jgi:glutamate dehydrogenase (NAD(P)+)